MDFLGQVCYPSFVEFPDVISPTRRTAMIYAWPQTEHAVSELQAAVKTAENVRWYRRLKIIQFSMAGSNVPQLRKQFEVCTATIRNYIKAYNANAVAVHERKTVIGFVPLAYPPILLI